MDSSRRRKSKIGAMRPTGVEASNLLDLPVVVPPSLSSYARLGSSIGAGNVGEEPSDADSIIAQPMPRSVSMYQSLDVGQHGLGGADSSNDSLSSFNLGRGLVGRGQGVENFLLQSSATSLRSGDAGSWHVVNQGIEFAKRRLGVLALLICADAQSFCTLSNENKQFFAMLVDACMVFGRSITFTKDGNNTNKFKVNFTNDSGESPREEVEKPGVLRFIEESLSGVCFERDMVKAINSTGFVKQVLEGVDDGLIKLQNSLLNGETFCSDMLNRRVGLVKSLVKQFVNNPTFLSRSKIMGYLFGNGGIFLNPLCIDLFNNTDGSGLLVPTYDQLRSYAKKLDEQKRLATEGDKVLFVESLRKRGESLVDFEFTSCVLPSSSVLAQVNACIEQLLHEVEAMSDMYKKEGLDGISMDTYLTTMNQYPGLISGRPNDDTIVSHLMGPVAEIVKRIGGVATRSRQFPHGTQEWPYMGYREFVKNELDGRDFKTVTECEQERVALSVKKNERRLFTDLLTSVVFKKPIECTGAHDGGALADVALLYGLLNSLEIKLYKNDQATSEDKEEILKSITALRDMLLHVENELQNLRHKCAEFISVGTKATVNGGYNLLIENIRDIGNYLTPVTYGIDGPWWAPSRENRDTDVNPIRGIVRTANRNGGTMTVHPRVNNELELMERNFALFLEMSKGTANDVSYAQRFVLDNIPINILDVVRDASLGNSINLEEELEWSKWLSNVAKDGKSKQLLPRMRRNVTPSSMLWQQQIFNGADGKVQYRLGRINEGLSVATAASRIPVLGGSNASLIDTYSILPPPASNSLSLLQEACYSVEDADRDNSGQEWVANKEYNKRALDSLRNRSMLERDRRALGGTKFKHMPYEILFRISEQAVFIGAGIGMLSSILDRSHVNPNADSSDTSVYNKSITAISNTLHVASRDMITTMLQWAYLIPLTKKNKNHILRLRELLESLSDVMHGSSFNNIFVSNPALAESLTREIIYCCYSELLTPSGLKSCVARFSRYVDKLPPESKHLKYLSEVYFRKNRSVVEYQQLLTEEYCHKSNDSLVSHNNNIMDNLLKQREEYVSSSRFSDYEKIPAMKEIDYSADVICALKVRHNNVKRQVYALLSYINNGSMNPLSVNSSVGVEIDTSCYKRILGDCANVFKVLDNPSKDVIKVELDKLRSSLGSENFDNVLSTTLRQCAKELLYIQERITTCDKIIYIGIKRLSYTSKKDRKSSEFLLNILKKIGVFVDSTSIDLLLCPDVASEACNLLRDGVSETIMDLKRMFPDLNIGRVEVLGSSPTVVLPTGLDSSEKNVVSSGVRLTDSSEEVMPLGYKNKRRSRMFGRSQESNKLPDYTLEGGVNTFSSTFDLRKQTQVDPICEATIEDYELPLLEKDAKLVCSGFASDLGSQSPFVSSRLQRSHQRRLQKGSRLVLPAVQEVQELSNFDRSTNRKDGLKDRIRRVQNESYLKRTQNKVSPVVAQRFQGVKSTFLVVPSGYLQFRRVQNESYLKRTRNKVGPSTQDNSPKSIFWKDSMLL